MRGFFMIELMLYVAIGALLSALVFGHVQKIIMYSAQSQKKSHATAQVMSAVQYIAHDLRVAPAQLSAWKTFSEHEIIWQQGDNDIGYLFQDEVLKKYVGAFDQSTHVWKHKKTYKVADHVQAVVFTAEHTAGYMTCITSVFTQQGQSQVPYTLVVALRNGVVV